MNLTDAEKLTIRHALTVATFSDERLLEQLDQLATLTKPPLSPTQLAGYRQAVQTRLTATRQLHVRFIENSLPTHPSR